VTLKDAIVVSYYSENFNEARGKRRVGSYGQSRFGMNEVIPGWVKGLPGMRVGSRRELIVPPGLGYRGHTLIYVIDLLAVQRNGAVT
jgi:peptidylprolyl isomerase